MKAVIPKNSRYIPLTQQRWCCVPTCIQMVMLRHNIPLVPAELLGYELGLIVPNESTEYFWNVKTGDKPNAGYGTQINNPKFDPDNAFSKLNIPLTMSYKLINEFRDYDEFVHHISEIDYENDYLICYDWGNLFYSDYHNGHVCVLDNVDLENETIQLVDPDYNAPKWRIVDIKKIYEAMKYHGEEKFGGIWEIRKL